ncbi:MAG: shikimate dehydrogenase [Actinomycetota bacterium]|nr:shikimate dehydrogenase [Actinomycetota bacterium]
MIARAPRLGVAGWPVAHSRSPAMHNAALAELGLPWRYLRLPIPPGELAETVRALPGAGFRGINVTIPHKEAALALADEATEAARAIGAANTLTFDPQTGAIEADNTDAPGLLEAIPASHDPRGRTALVLGAGGAARAAVHALLGAGAADVAVHNRTRERAERMVAELGGGRVVDAPVEADIVVNATPVGLQEFKAMPLAADTVVAGSCVVDMVYRDGGTRLLQIARDRGAVGVDGLEVLIAQGAASLERWTGRPVSRQTMRQALT